MSGFSRGTTKIHKESNDFNVAVSGQEANHLTEQARTLISRLRNSKEIDFANDWKLVTLFIGGNDLCDFCKDKELHSPASYIKYITEALDILHAELPKTFVNMVNVLNVKDIEDMNSGLSCSVLHKSECPCAAYPTSDQKVELEVYFQNYTKFTRDLVESGRYDTTDDFTVVLQPFFIDYPAPRLPNGKVDLSFFAPDCFHFSAKSHGKYNKKN